MASDQFHGADPKIIRRVLKEDIAARKLMLTVPGLIESEKIRHLIFITHCRLMRLHLNDPAFKPLL